MRLFRRRTVRMIAGLGLIGLTLAARPAPTTAPATAPSTPLPEVDALISRLSDSRWQVRNRAVERLVELGPAAEPQLASARASARSVDSRTRLDLALSRIHESQRSGASYVTLHIKSGKVHDALDVLAQGAGVRFDIEPGDVGGAAGPVTLDADQKPFWVVLRDLCAQAKLEVAAIDETGMITLRSGGDDDWGSRPASIQGPYMLVARRMELSRSLDFVKPRDVSNSYTLVLLTYAEPKLRPMFWTVRGIDQCTTETGQEVRAGPDNSLETGELNSDNETRFQFTAPPGSGNKLARLQLGARFMLSDKSQVVEVPDVFNIKKRVVGGWRLTIRNVTRTDDGRYSAGVTVYRDEHTPDEWTDRMGLLDRAQPKLLDAAGKPMESGGASLNEGADEWTWSNEFSPPTPDGKPSKLVWDFPLETRHVDVTFDLKDLPLP